MTNSRLVATGLSLVLAVVSVSRLAGGCSPVANKPTCASTLGELLPANPEASNYMEVMEMGGEIRAAVTESCVADRWSQEAIDCFAGASGSVSGIIARCEDALGPAAAKVVGDKVSAIESKVIDKAFDRLVEESKRKPAEQPAAQ